MLEVVKLFFYYSSACGRWAVIGTYRSCYLYDMLCSYLFSSSLV